MRSGDISLRQLCFLIPWAVLTLSVPALADFRVLATGPDDKPDDPFFEPSRTVFDCAGRDTFTLSAGVIDTLQDDTTGGETLLSGYACRSWNEAGPEHIYRLEIQEPLELWVELQDLGANDLDLFLLNDCDTDACVVSDNTNFGVVLETPGTYYLIVDGYGTAEGPYTLIIETRILGVPLSVCAPGGAEEVVCAGDVIVRDGNLLDQPNLVQGFDCNTTLLRGGEAWYALALPAVHEATLDVAPSGLVLDPALWLFDGCGPDAVCLAFADEKSGGQSESLIYVNDADAPLTVYVAVDAQRPVTTESEGAFELTITCQSNVPAEKTSLGSLRAMYR